MPAVSDGVVTLASTEIEMHRGLQVHLDSFLQLTRTTLQQLSSRSSMTASDDALARLLKEVRAFVKRLDVVDALRDDIVSDVALVVVERLDLVEHLDPEGIVPWARAVTFLVARHSTRADLRRTAAWKRLQGSLEPNALLHDPTGDPTTAASLLAAGLSVLSDLDRQLLVSRYWDGHTSRNLAATHGLTEAAVRQRLMRTRTAARKEIRKRLDAHVTNDDRKGITR